MDITEAAAELGVQLLPWQKEAGQAVLDGRPVARVGGKRSGRNTLARVVAHAQRRNREAQLRELER